MSCFTTRSFARYFLRLVVMLVKVSNCFQTLRFFQYPHSPTPKKINEVKVDVHFGAFIFTLHTIHDRSMSTVCKKKLFSCVYTNPPRQRVHKSPGAFSCERTQKHRNTAFSVDLYLFSQPQRHILHMIGLLTAEHIDHWSRLFRGQRETLSAALRGPLYSLYVVLSCVSLKIRVP